jgi:hypothetical protein
MGTEGFTSSVLDVTLDVSYPLKYPPAGMTN